MFQNTFASNFTNVLSLKCAILIIGFVLRIFVYPGSTFVIFFRFHLITWICPHFPFGAFSGHTLCSKSVFDVLIWL